MVWKGNNYKFIAVTDVGYLLFQSGLTLCLSGFQIHSYNVGFISLYRHVGSKFRLVWWGSGAGLDGFRRYV